jgi:hypothetical protein
VTSSSSRDAEIWTVFSGWVGGADEGKWLVLAGYSMKPFRNHPNGGYDRQVAECEDPLDAHEIVQLHEHQRRQLYCCCSRPHMHDGEDHDPDWVTARPSRTQRVVYHERCPKCKYHNRKR